MTAVKFKEYSLWCVYKKDRFPLRYFRLGWMRVSVDKFALPQNRRTIIVRLVINLL